MMRVNQKIKVSLCLSGDDFDLKEVTQKLDLIPTETRTKDSFPPQGLALTCWELEAKKYNCVAVSIPFEDLLNVLKSKVSIIKSICLENDITADFVVAIHANADDRPEVVLTKEIVSFAASINAEIGFDIYYHE